MQNSYRLEHLKILCFNHRDFDQVLPYLSRFPGVPHFYNYQKHKPIKERTVVEPKV